MLLTRCQVPAARQSTRAASVIADWLLHALSLLKVDSYLGMEIKTSDVGERKFQAVLQKEKTKGSRACEK